MTTTEKQSQGEAYLDPSDYPRWWNWDEDGDICAGSFVRFTRGHSEYGEKTIVVLAVEGEERSIWLHETVLFDEFRRELLHRPSRELDLGEMVIVKRGEKRKTQDGKRSFRSFRIRFPDRPEPSTSDLLKLDEEPGAKTPEKPDDGDVPY
jgi:hypothetical protein